jgi:hypothetical protein
MNWFEVDKQGLAKLLEKKGKSFVLFELIQNAWDTDAGAVHVRLLPIAGSPYVQLSVSDDHPDGFANLAHAFTLFAESEKKGDPSKRGRFNLGEKLVLALCRKATISSTKGTVIFDENGRHRSGHKTERGSSFEGEIRMTREEMNDALRQVRSLLPPSDKVTVINGERLPSRHTLSEFFVTLPTEISDAEGVLRRSERSTMVEVHHVGAGETATLYEMGIPVVETGDKWHVNVMQKVPLNADRDNVTPSYLQKVRVAVLNHMYDRIDKAEATAAWVRDASASLDAIPEVVEHVITQRFGDKRVIADPNDPEGTKLAMSRGYTVIPGGALSGGEWSNVKRFSAALPAGQVTPSPKPYSSDPDADTARTIPEDKWTDGMNRAATFARKMFAALIGGELRVTMVSEITLPWSACYGRGRLDFNVGRLGKAWFEVSNPETITQLLIHEFGHHFSGDHLSSEYHDALCMLGAKLAGFMQGKTFDVFKEAL